MVPQGPTGVEDGLHPAQFAELGGMQVRLTNILFGGMCTAAPNLRGIFSSAINKCKGLVRSMEVLHPRMIQPHFSTGNILLRVWHGELLYGYVSKPTWHPLVGQGRVGTEICFMIRSSEKQIFLFYFSGCKS